MTEAIKILDTAIMIGCGLNECDLLTEFTQKLHDYITKHHPVPFIDAQDFFQTNSSNAKLSHTCDVDVEKKPSIEYFSTRHLHLFHPVKIINAIEHWPALCKWKDINYLMKIAAFRTVPVELGKAYTDDNWGQNLFKFGDFLQEISKESSSTCAYLAQHDLFDQIPMLKNDFSIPDYCSVISDDVIIKSWIGPKNTISSMHTDAKHNLLCQVIGEKLIILASPAETMNLYPYDSILSNTSQIDAENLDFEKFPLTKKVKFKRIILRAGEMLYIPKNYWHYVRSLTPSISISFWFELPE
jgi:lysine-specific demethylase 8